jgi:hypothetical protein
MSISGCGAGPVKFIFPPVSQTGYPCLEDLANLRSANAPGPIVEGREGVPIPRIEPR